MTDWQWPHPTPRPWLRGPWPAVFARMIELPVSALPSYDSATLSALRTPCLAELEEPWSVWIEHGW